MNSTARKGAALGAGAAGGLALAALLLPQLASTLNPTKLGAALLAIVLALLSTGAQHLNQRRKQRAALEGALRVWPPTRLGAADLAALGVYPPRDADGRPAAYRPREADEELRAALARATFIVVLGPPGAGKSRAAGEAARRVLADLPAIVPLNVDALRSLADGSVDLTVPEPRMCLWLDGLDRFIDALDLLTLQTLEGLAGKWTLVASIRTEPWADLLSGTGQSSESARWLASHAELIELGALPAAAPPGEQEPGPSDAGSETPVRKLSAPWRDVWLLALAAALAATLACGLILGLNGDLVLPRPIGEQMAQILAGVLRGDRAGARHVVLSARVSFHSTDDPSWLLVVEDRQTHDEFYAGAANGVGPPPRSDEVRIYDVVGGRLRLELDFQPAGIGATAAEWQELNGGSPLVADYDSDGSDELIAGYAIPAQATSAFVPFAIYWYDGRYRLASLAPDKPELSNAGLTPAAIRFRREAYEGPVSFENGAGGQRFRHLKLTGYRIQAFAYVATPIPRLLTGYFSAVPVFAQPQVLELHASQFRAGGPALVPCTPTNAFCPAPQREQEVIVPPDRSAGEALLTAWGQVGSRWEDPVRVTQR
ncbi:MAG TPA: hypothetical protein VIJ20_10440 [Solirubrobacteraceae bacterium]